MFIGIWVVVAYCVVLWGAYVGSIGGLDLDSVVCVVVLCVLGSAVILDSPKRNVQSAAH